jgi:predicted ArsR family transcriptional regulator
MEQGVVEIVGRGVSRKQGRPTILYALTSQVQQNNLDGLVHALLEELLQNTSSEERRSLLHSIARRLAPVDEPPGVSMSHRLFRAVQVLNLMHYQARWEAHTRAPRLILGHCPYSSIIAEHPELCQIDQNMLDSMLGAPTVQIEKLARDSRGATFCMFMVKER